LIRCELCGGGVCLYQEAVEQGIFPSFPVKMEKPHLQSIATSQQADRIVGEAI